ncbi:hypothetical protein JHK85_048056 [Glycine max]|nr:hypothetical protein JHK86_047464 [Glycine max]KAG4943410.1 hypothetical protein JHK85_048056 [Glycine max]KAH1118553.1 hypothetical protein GYH30_047356 [Glycine max]
MGNSIVYIIIENNEDTSKIKPKSPMHDICHVTAVQNRTITYDTFPSSYSLISLSKLLHSPLTMQQHEATREG